VPIARGCHGFLARTRARLTMGPMSSCVINTAARADGFSTATVRERSCLVREIALGSSSSLREAEVSGRADFSPMHRLFSRPPSSPPAGPHHSSHRARPSRKGPRQGALLPQGTSPPAPLRKRRGVSAGLAIPELLTLSASGPRAERGTVACARFGRGYGRHGHVNGSAASPRCEPARCRCPAGPVRFPIAARARRGPAGIDRVVHPGPPDRGVTSRPARQQGEPQSRDPQTPLSACGEGPGVRSSAGAAKRRPDRFTTRCDECLAAGRGDIATRVRLLVQRPPAPRGDLTGALGETSAQASVRAHQDRGDLLASRPDRSLTVAVLNPSAHAAGLTTQDDKRPIVRRARSERS